MNELAIATSKPVNIKEKIMLRLTQLKFDKKLEGINKIAWASPDQIVTTKEGIWIAPSELFLGAINQFVEKYVAVYGAYFPEPTLTKLAIAWENETPMELSMTLQCVSEGGTYIVSLPTLSPLQVINNSHMIKQLSAIAIDEWLQYDLKRPKQLAMSDLQLIAEG